MIPERFDCAVCGRRIAKSTPPMPELTPDAPDDYRRPGCICIGRLPKPCYWCQALAPERRTGHAPPETRTTADA